MLHNDESKGISQKLSFILPRILARVSYQSSVGSVVAGYPELRLDCRQHRSGYQGHDSVEEPPSHPC
jgi:hypothetical protein